MAANPDSASQRTIEERAAHWISRRDAGLSPAEEEEMQRWVAANPQNRAALEQFAAAWAALATPSRKGAAAEYERKITQLARRNRRFKVTQYAAALMVVAFIFVAWRPWQTAAPRATPVSAIVHLAERRTLSDGSVVELRPNSEIRVAFSPTQRSVTLLKGEAHFEVRKDPTCPFVVSAHGVAVQAVGTAFAVQLDRANVQVLVTEGVVAINKMAEERSPVSAQAATAVEAGKGATIEASSSGATAVRAIPNAEMSERLAWRKPRLEFKRTPLSEAVELMNRYAPSSAPRLTIGNAAAGNVGVIGVFRPDNIQGFVAILEAGFNIKAERAENRIVLRKTE